MIFLVIINLVFFMGRLAPGNPAQIIAQSLPVHTPNEIQTISERLGLNVPLYVQYTRYLEGIFTQFPPNLGISYDHFPQGVTYLFEQRIGWSLILLLSSLFLSVLLAYGIAMVSSMRRGGKFDAGSLYGAVAMHAMPAYWVGMVLIWIFAVWLIAAPMFGSYAFVYKNALQFAGSVAAHAILPIVTMTIAIFGTNYILLRGTVQEVLQSDYVIAAKTRGLRPSFIARRYILRNSFLPLVSVLSYSLAVLVRILTFVESVFAYPRIGDLIVDGVDGRDYPVIAGGLFWLTIKVIVGGIIGDLILVRLDPRLK